MRVLLAITELEVGGAERCLTRLAARLDRSRFEPLVVSLAPRPADAQAELVRELEAAGVRVEFLNLASKLSFPAAIRRMRRLYERERPGLVQSFLHHANVVACLAARGSGLPVSTGIRVAEPKPLRWRLERWASRTAQRHVCVSQAVARFAARRMRLAKAKLEVIPNGIEAARFRDAQPARLSDFGIREPRRALLYVGRLDPQKGVAWLLQLAPQLLAAAPGHDLLIVGRGVEEAALRRGAAERGLAERVHFAGWSSNVPQLMRAADLLLVPSRWEGMPNVILEAMAAGRAVVATRAEGVVELLGEAAAEQTVPAGDSAAFIATTKALLVSPKRLRDIGLENQRRVASEFSLDAMVAAYERLFATLAASAPV